MAQGDLRIYDPDQIFISLAGIPLSGWADGEFCRIERENPSFEDVVGTDGEVTRSKTNDERATVTLRLMQSSPSNDLLSALHLSDKNTPGGVGVGVLLIQDLQGTSVFTAEKSWISKEPDVSYDRTPTEREWIIRVAKLVSNHGGAVA
jgi:hypothetical protein